MTIRFLALAVAAAGLAGCAANPSTPPGPYYEREARDGRPGMFGDLTWNIDTSSNRQARNLSAAEQEEFKKWRESAGNAERQEFEEWRAWQEWKRRNPK
jgi:hypothetical protein